MAVIESFHDSREDASAEAAGRIATLLSNALADADRTGLIVSGGSTPAGCLRRLAAAMLPWQRVTVTPSDERWVPPEHADSNEKMLRETLLQSQAAAATYIPHYRGQQDIAAACESLAAELAALPRPFAATLLGMGEDGHFASLFPDAQGLAQALAIDGGDSVISVQTAASPHPRISLTLALLVDCREVLLLIFGDAKRAVYEQARAGDERLPVSHLIHQEHTPVRVIWAP